MIPPIRAWAVASVMGLALATAGQATLAQPVRSVSGPTREHADLVRMANPATYVTKDDPPFLIAHGEKDTLVPIEQSQLLVDALNKAGVEVTVEVVKGGGHGGATAAQDARLNQLVLEFLDKHVKSAPTSQPAGDR